MRALMKHVLLLFALGGLIGGCKAEMTPKEVVAAKADQTVRQLIAGLNAQNRTVVGKLVVVTSSTGGAPRAPTSEELKRLAYPKPPFEFVGSGKPGTMIVRAGDKQKRILDLIVVKDELRVVARQVPLSSFDARPGEKGVAMPSGMDTQVLAVMHR